METPKYPVKTLVFTGKQEIVQLPDETSQQLHERLRPRALTSFVPVTEPTVIETPSWYTFDPKEILTDIPDSVVISTSTCKHEPPFLFFVGKRETGWQRKIPGEVEKYRYQLNPLGRELNDEEKNAIYDKM